MHFAEKTTRQIRAERNAIIASIHGMFPRSFRLRLFEQRIYLTSLAADFALLKAVYSENKNRLQLWKHLFNCLLHHGSGEKTDKAVLWTPGISVNVNTPWYFQKKSEKIYFKIKKALVY